MGSQTTTQGSRAARTALALLFTINLFNYIDRQVLAAVEPLLRRDFGLDRAQTGMLSTAFLVSYMLGAPILGSLADRFSRWLLIGLSVAAWSLASGWTGLVSSFSGLILARIFVGIGEAGYGPAAPALISDYFSQDQRGKVMSFFYLAIPVGSALGYVLGGFIAGMWGWRWSFFAVVPPGLVLAALCYFMRDPRAIRANDVPTPKPKLQDYVAILRIPSYLFNTAAMTAMTFAIGGISFWLPGYILEVRGHEFPNSGSMEQLGAKINTIFGVIVVVGGLVSTLLGGWLGDKLRVRYGGAYLIVSGVGIFISFPSILAMLWLPFPYAWGAIFCAVFFLFFNTGPANTALANVTSSKVRATAFALNILIIHALGDAISPPLLGWISQRTSMDTAMVMISVVMVFASGLWLYAARFLASDTAAASAADARARSEALPN